MSNGPLDVDHSQQTHRGIIPKGLERFVDGPLLPQPDWERVSDTVLTVLAPCKHSFALNGTNTFLVGTGPKRLLIDCGDVDEADAQRYVDRLSALMAEEGVTELVAVIATHAHIDHIGGDIFCRVRLLPEAEQATGQLNNGDLVSGVAFENADPKGKNRWTATEFAVVERGSTNRSTNRRPPQRVNLPHRDHQGGGGGNSYSGGGGGGRSARYGGRPKAELAAQQGRDVEAARAQANDRFEAEPLPMGIPAGLETPRKRFSFTWDIVAVPLAVEASVAAQIVVPGEYGWLEDAEIDQVTAMVDGMAMNVSQALSLRSALLQQKCVFGHSRLLREAPNLARRYAGGTSVVELSKQCDFPPMNVFRTVLREQGWNKTQLAHALKDPKARLPPREQTEMIAAEAVDSVASSDQTVAQELAEEFEVELAAWFTSRGVRVRQQTEIAAEQIATLGKTVSTPDLLFLDHVEINGEPVAWIDAKHYYGSDVGFVRKKFEKQGNRYVKLWGAGALVFSKGFCDNLFAPGITLLTAPSSVTAAVDAKIGEGGEAGGVATATATATDGRPPPDPEILGLASLFQSAKDFPSL